MDFRTGWWRCHGIRKKYTPCAACFTGKIMPPSPMMTAAPTTISSSSSFRRNCAAAWSGGPTCTASPSHRPFPWGCCYPSKSTPTVVIATSRGWFLLVCTGWRTRKAANTTWSRIFTLTFICTRSWYTRWAHACAVSSWCRNLNLPVGWGPLEF